MKKLLLLACAAFAFAACNDNDDETRFATENTKIVDGSMTGSYMHFLGTSASTSTGRPNSNSPGCTTSRSTCTARASLRRCPLRRCGYIK